MRILVLTIEYPPLGGGASPMAHEINKNYMARGHQITVITMPFHGLPGEEFVDGVRIFRVPCRRSKMHISYPSEHVSFLFAARKFLMKFLPGNPQDVCHAHFIIPTGFLARWVKKKFNIPFIITAHGSDVPGFNPDRFYFLHLLSPPLIRNVIRYSSGIVVPSLYLKSLILKVIHHEHAKIIHIPNGINTDYFIPADKERTIVSSGRLLERKGFHYLIEAVSKEDLGYTVHICGDGPMMGRLKDQAEKSLTPIVFHGWIDNRDELYKRLLAQATYYCLVSSNENASTSLMEAMSSGCVVITSDVSGCPETVSDSGICIAPGNSEVLLEVFKSLNEDQPLRSALMAAARQRAIEKYGWPSITEKYLELLQSAANS